MNLMLLQISAANTATNAPANTSSNPVTSTVAAVGDKIGILQNQADRPRNDIWNVGPRGDRHLVVGVIVTRSVGRMVQKWLDKQQMERRSRR